MFMFNTVMKKYFITNQQLLRCPLCDDCDKTLQHFYNCKADLASSNKDFLNYVDSNNKVDLYKALVDMGKLKRFQNESVAIKVCRICFKPTQNADYREVKSWSGPLAKMITLCLPEFDISINLTDHTYLCPECYSSLLQYNRFLSLCLKVTETKKRHLGNLDPLELTPNDLKEKRQKMCSNVVKQKVRPLSMAKLIPKVPKKRGRPRKDKDLPKFKLKQRRKPRRPPPLTEYSVMDETEHYECQICPGEFDNIEMLRDHINGHKSAHNFRCWKCGKKTYTFESFRQHFMKHGFINVYKTIKIKWKDSNLKQEVSKDVRTNLVSSSKSSTTGITCSTCKETLNNLNIYIDHSCAPSSMPTSKISCTFCTQKFDTLDQYISHGCSSKHVTCGNCLKIFHTLDGHSCTSSLPSGVKTSSAGIEDNPRANEATIQSRPVKEDPDIPEIKKENQFTCCLCMSVSETEQELSVHECIGTVCDRVKKEDLYECFLCLCFFASEDKLSRHMCTAKTVEHQAVYDITENLESKIKIEEIDLGKTEDFEH